MKLQKHYKNTINPQRVEHSPNQVSSTKRPRIIAIISLIIGIALVIAGIFRGEAVTVFNKATRICMECIGIG
ncbi:MAG: hypothetical protein IJP62_12460 [Treponema sp.]|nr:hypothetical protein [Treponema sp.]